MLRSAFGTTLRRDRQFVNSLPVPLSRDLDSAFASITSGASKLDYFMFFFPSPVPNNTTFTVQAALNYPSKSTLTNRDTAVSRSTSCQTLHLQQNETSLTSCIPDAQWHSPGFLLSLPPRHTPTYPQGDTPRHHNRQWTPPPPQQSDASSASWTRTRLPDRHGWTPNKPPTRLTLR